jgi:hypothetical protein
MQHGGLRLRLATNKVSRGEVLLEKLAPVVGLTPCGKDWLTQALDPFHDNQLTSVSGWPDVVTNPSIVHTVKDTFSISFESGTNCCAHLHVFPWLSYQTLAPMNTLGGNRLNATAAVEEGALYPHVAVLTSSDGYSTGQLAFNGDNASVFGAFVPDNILAGRGRLIGMGIEAIDVTAELYRQGTISGYRSIGADRSDPETWQLAYSGDDQCVEMFSIAKPPTTPGEAMILPGTRQWASKDGAYLVIPIDQSNEPQLAKPVGTYFWDKEEELVPQDANVGAKMYQNFSAINGQITLLFNHLAPIPSIGLFWEGMNEKSVIQIKVIWYYESFPTPKSPYVTLAKPSCEYDPVALKLYTEVLNSLPIMVPSDWNPAGEWWWDVVTAIRDNAEAVGSLFGGPGKMVGAAVSKLAGWGQDNYMTAPGQSGKPKANNQQRRGNPNNAGQKQVVTKTVVQNQNARKRQNNAPRQNQGKKVTTTTVTTNNPNGRR